MKAQKERQEAEAKERHRNLKLKKAEADLAFRRAVLIGETIIGAELTADEKLTIGRVLARRSKVPADWSKLSPWLPPALLPVAFPALPVSDAPPASQGEAVGDVFRQAAE